jgi:hypothetical protein
VTHVPEAPTNGQDARTGEGTGQLSRSSVVRNAGSPHIPSSTPAASKAGSAPGAPGGPDTGAPAVRAEDGTEADAGSAAAVTGDRAGRSAPGRAEGSASDLDRPAKQGRGLTLQVVIEDAKEFSAQASTNTRYLAAGGLAVVWALAKGDVAALRRPSMSLAVVAFVLALVSDYLHYSLATKKLVALIERSAAAGATYDSPVMLTRGDVPAAAWFKWKTRLLIAAYVVLTWAFVMTVFPEVGEVVRRIVALITK